jgi:hypothetical protein
MSEDLCDLAGRLGSITRSLEDDNVELFLEEKSSGVGDVSSYSGNSLNSDFILWGFFGLFSDLNVFIGSS